MTNLHTFLNDRSQEEALKMAYPNFDHETPEEKQKIRWLWANKRSTTLVGVYGVDNDSDHINSNSRTADR